MKYLKRFFRKNWFVVLIILVLTLLAYGQTIQMYFFIDDNGLLYKLKNFDKDVWLFGRGIFGEGPYRHIVDQFIPFYPIFGINPTPYFSVGVFLYFLASVTIYLFFLRLAKNKLIAFSSAAIFASGHVGSETMFGIVNSWQTMRGIIMALGVFWLFYKFIETKKLLFYGLALVLFFFSLDTVYPRAHGLIFPLLVFDFLFWPVTFRLRELVKFGIRQLPFVLLYYQIYLSNTEFIKRFKIFNLAQDVFSEEKFVVLFTLFANIGNLFLPDVLTSHIDRLVVQYFPLPVGSYLGSTIAGLFFCALVVFLLFLKRKDVLFFRLTVFSIVWMISSTMLFIVRETSLVLHTAHRYFSYSFVGLSLFWALLFYLLSDRERKFRLFTLLNIIIIVTYLALGMSSQYSLNVNRSIPARKFFADFDKAVPNVPKDAVIYFDLANDNQVKGRFGSFFGGMFSEASNFALYSEGVDFMTDFLFTYEFDDIIKGLDDKTTTLDKIFTFYYNENGLIDTTSSVRQLLTTKKIVNIDPSKFSSTTSFRPDRIVFSTQTDIYLNSGRWVGKNPLITIIPPDATESVVPSKITFSMNVKPIFPPLPYEAEGNLIDISENEKSRIFAYINSQNDFRKNSTATSASFWKEQEPKFAIDGRLETSWRGHRGYWDDIDRGITKNIEYFQVDLKRVLDIGQLMWVSSQKPLVPIHYRILTSIDGNTWDEAMEVRKIGTLTEGTSVFDSFPPRQTRFIKMEILETYGNDGPELKEFEAIEATFVDLDRKLIDKVRATPFAQIETLADFKSALSFASKNSTLRFYWMSDADDQQDPINYVEFPLVIDEGFHEYSVSLPATGINWTKFTLEGLNLPAEISLTQARIIYKSMQ